MFLKESRHIPCLTQKISGYLLLSKIQPFKIPFSRRSRRGIRRNSEVASFPKIFKKFLSLGVAFVSCIITMYHKKPNKSIRKLDLDTSLQSYSFYTYISDQGYSWQLSKTKLQLYPPPGVDLVQLNPP